MIPKKLPENDQITASRKTERCLQSFTFKGTNNSDKFGTVWLNSQSIYPHPSPWAVTLTLVVKLVCLDDPKSYAGRGFIARNFRACLFTIQVADLKSS